MSVIRGNLVGTTMAPEKIAERIGGGSVDNSIVANALKGSVTGKAVAINDVSPLEHEMSVKVDVPSATVTKFGKNLVNLDTALSDNGLTKDENGIYHLLGNSKAVVFPKLIPANTPVHFKFQDFNGYNGKSNALFTLSVACEGGAGISSGKLFFGGNWNSAWSSFANELTVTTDYPMKQFALIKYTASDDYYCEFSGLQVEIGTTATDYEPYKEPVTYTADENGVVKDIVGNGESMTLIADSDATITAEYNKDTNKVIESLVQAIISLGGNV